MKTAEREAREALGRDPVFHISTFAPCAHLFYNYPPDAQKRHNKEGSMTFFYKIEMLNGLRANIRLNPKKAYSDWAWVSYADMPKYLDPSLYKAIKDALQPPLVALEDPNISKLPPCPWEREKVQAEGTDTTTTTTTTTETHGMISLYYITLHTATH